MARKHSAAIAAQIRRKGKPRGRPFKKGQPATVGRPFPKGKSPNPGGRPRDVAGVQALLVNETIRQSAEIVEAVIRKAIRGSAPHAGIVFDRVLGKIPTPHIVTGKDGSPIEVESKTPEHLLKMTTEELADYGRRLADKLSPPGSGGSRGDA